MLLNFIHEIHMIDHVHYFFLETVINITFKLMMTNNEFCVRRDAPSSG